MVNMTPTTPAAHRPTDRRKTGQARRAGVGRCAAGVVGVMFTMRRPPSG